MSRLLKSRKFWIMIVDVFISTATYFVNRFVSPQTANDVIWLIAAWQPVVYAVIAGIATEDAANITAYSVSDAAAITAGAPSGAAPAGDAPQ